jgi:peptidyl-dipeptidase A
MRSVSIAGLLLGALLAAACVDTEFRSEADAYLAAYEIEGQGLYYEWAEAEWASNTRIVEGDPTNAARTRDAREAMMRFAGSVENIDTIRAYLSQRGRLSDLQERQLEKMLSAAAEGPMTIPDVVLRRIAVETDQVERLYGFEFTLGSRPVTPNEIDALLRTSTDLSERLAVWQASKEVGPVLKPGALELRDLRNQTVQAASAAAVPRASHVGALRAGRAVRCGGTATAAGALATEPVGPGLERADCGGGHQRRLRGRHPQRRVGDAAG